MAFSFSTVQVQLKLRGLWPDSKLAWVTCYIFGLGLLLAVLKGVLGVFHSSYAASLGGWISLLTFVAAVLFAILAYRWLKGKVLWRLRNRLIVTYVFIGVTPVVLLLILTLGTFYLFAGQFATFIVTSQISSELQSLDATNSTLARDLMTRLNRSPASQGAPEIIRQANHELPDHQITVWLNQDLVLDSAYSEQHPAFPAGNKNSFLGIARDHAHLYLRALATLPTRAGELTVMTSKPIDQGLVERLATNLGQVSLYGSGISISNLSPNASAAEKEKASHQASISIDSPQGKRVLNTGGGDLTPTFAAGTVPASLGRLDKQVNFPTTVDVTNWETGDANEPIAVSVQTRLSRLYDRLFGSLGEFAPAIEFVLLFLAIFFGIIELVALVIGTRLTRTITKAVAQLYDATIHINRGDFRHRIPVKSADQLATLATSFNSMTSSIENLIEEQKQKQRLENELAIAQEVQATLFPQVATQLETLEVHGFCRPARTVSGDYYDFLTINSDKLLLAVGDVSGKGISAALLMATIHSAVRAYSLEGIPQLQETAVAVAGGTVLTIPTEIAAIELSPGLLLGLLNHQLYASTPAEKYATLFLGMYNGDRRTLTYSNGGHLPPIVMATDGSVRRLDCGGTVVGLFDNMVYEQGSFQLQQGDLVVAYSDGVTEPENDFGEFGEQRLIDLLRENRSLSLDRISELVTAAVDDWIGPGEQPDDVTLVLARVR